MSTTTNAIYTYTADLFTSATSAGIDFGDVNIKIMAITYASAPFNNLGGNYNENGMYQYIFTYDNLLNHDDKAALDAFVTNYVYIPKIDISVIGRETKPTGVNAGTFTANVWTVRKFNEFIGMQVFATINSDSQITVAPGTYIIIVKSPTVNVGGSRVRIHNITDGTYSYGSNTYSPNNNTIITSDIHQYYNFFVTTTFEIQHICEITVPDIGLGKAVGFGLTEVYGRVFVHQTQGY